MAQKYFKASIMKLESLRVARGWSREELASKAIVSTRTLDSLMAGKPGVLSTFSKIAKALGTPVDTIIDIPQEKLALPKLPGNRCIEIVIRIPTDFDKFDETKQLPKVLRRIASMLGGDEIWGAEVEAGSTAIRFYLTKEQYQKFIAAYEAGELKDLAIIDIKANDYTDNMDNHPAVRKFEETVGDSPLMRLFRESDEADRRRRKGDSKGG